SYFKNNVRHAPLFPCLERSARTRIAILNDEHIGHEVFQGISFFEIHNQITAHINLPIGIAMLEQIIDADHPHPVQIGFAHRPAIRFWINDFGGSGLNHASALRDSFLSIATLIGARPVRSRPSRGEWRSYTPPSSGCTCSSSPRARPRRKLLLGRRPVPAAR